MPNIWQIGGGPASRSYADDLIRWQVGLIGPGSAGPWSPDRNDEEFNGSFVRRFATEMHTGDIVLLRQGASTVLAIGAVADEKYLYEERFSDVNGWGLHHCRRIRWFKLGQPQIFPGLAFGAQATRFGKVNNTEVREFAERFINSPPTAWQQEKLRDLPAAEPQMQVVPESLKALREKAVRLNGIYRSESAQGEPPSESEMVNHFVVPLLLALGWPPEKIAVEWHRVDVAVFNATRRTPQNLRFIIEAKKLWKGLETRYGQADGYQKKLGVQCDILVTDGFRYLLYPANSGGEAGAYANLTNLKQSADQLFNRLRNPNGV